MITIEKLKVTEYCLLLQDRTAKRHKLLL